MAGSPNQIIIFIFFKTIFVSSHMYLPREPRIDPSNHYRSLNSLAGRFKANWSSVIMSLHQNSIDKSRWWELKEVSACPKKGESTVNSPYVKLVAFSERIPTGVLTVVNNYG